MKFLNWILEARRGGTPKISIIEALSKYKDDPDIYISYTSLEKLGINPQYDYGTPLGIYFYPLKEIWRFVTNDTVPFAGERNWVWVVRAKNLLNLDTYTESDFINDEKKLRKYFEQLGHSPDVYGICYDAAFRDNSNKSGRSPGRFIWYLSHNVANNVEDRVISSRTPFRWTEILRKVLGYKGVRDTKGIIHQNEPQQAIMFSLRDLLIVEKIKNIKPDTTERIVAKNLIEYLELVKQNSHIGLESVIQNRITKTWANEKMIIIKDSAFQNMNLEEFKYILDLNVVEGITIIKIIEAKKYDPIFIKAAVDSKSIVFIEDVESAVFYIKEFHIFNRIQQYFEEKRKSPYMSWTRALINLPKVIESFTAKKYIEFMKGLTKDRILDVYDIFTATALMLDLKGNKKDAIGYFIGDIYPRFLQVEAAKNSPGAMDKVIELFKRDVLNRASIRGYPPLDSLEKFIDKKYIEKYW
ncbi:MAG: hypothetical protein WC503_02895 [Candidatus Shapirobacteria bacterium]